MNITTKIRLIGAVGAVRRDGTRSSLSRKAAALFAYLALEGSTNRSKIACLLWPGMSEAGARSNLRELLINLHGELGACIVGIDFLRISQSTSVDIRDEPDSGDARKLLAGLTYDDCEDFASWLASQRDRLRRVQTTRLMEEFVRVGQAL